MERIKIILVLCLLLLHHNVFSQGIGVNNLTPDASALWDMVSTDKGVLIPRMTSAERNAITSPATGLLVYDNTLNKFYYFNGTMWTTVGGDSGWSLTGDAGTAPATNFIGTTDAQSLLIKVNNVQAGFLDNAEGTYIGRNTFLGKFSGFSNTVTGYDNTYIGARAGFANTTGTLNTAVGAKALQSAVATYSNVAMGREAMQFCVSCVQSTAVGTGALQNGVSGYWNNAFGYLALRFTNNPGIGNNAFGSEALAYNTSNYNSAFGHFSLHANTTGALNTAFGNAAMQTNTVGNYNVAVGDNALGNNLNGSNNTALGFKAAFDASAVNRIVAIGDSALYFNKSTGNVAIGSRAMKSNNGGGWNTALGYESMYSNTSGFANTALGYSSLTFNTTGTGNTAVGSFALENNVIGTSVTAVGYGALRYSTSNDNTAIGTGSLGTNTIGKDNTAIGSLTLSNNISGNYNIGVGNNSLLLSTASSNNVTVGFNNLSVLSASGNVGNNTAIGNYAGDSYAAYSNCTFVGYQTDANATGYSNSTAIGNQAQVTASNQAKIGNTLVTSIGGFAGWTTFPSDIRFKKNIKENVPGLQFIRELIPVTYNIDISALSNKLNLPDSIIDAEAKIEKEKIVYTGFIAQQVETAAKKIGYDFSGIDIPQNENDFYGLRYSEFVVPLIKAVQELAKENNELKSALIDLNSKLNAIQFSLTSKHEGIK